MASLSTCHLELVVWDGNLVKSVAVVAAAVVVVVVVVVGGGVVVVAALLFITEVRDEVSIIAVNRQVNN